MSGCAERVCHCGSLQPDGESGVASGSCRRVETVPTEVRHVHPPSDLPAPAWSLTKKLVAAGFLCAVSGAAPRDILGAQVIPEGTGPCQGLGDLRFGLSSTVPV